MTALPIKRKPPGLHRPIVVKLVRAFSIANVWVYQASGGFIGSTFRFGAAFPRGLPVLLLTTTGWKSGIARTAPLLFLRDGEDLIVVASQGGQPKDPLWYRNLQANPNGEVQIRRAHVTVKAVTVVGRERDALWERLVAMYADYASYAAWTERMIPVVRLVPVRQ